MILNSVLLDTHAFAWALQGDDQLSADANQAIDDAAQVFVSAITIYEIAWVSAQPGTWFEHPDSVFKMAA